MNHIRNKRKTKIDSVISRHALVAGIELSPSPGNFSVQPALRFDNNFSMKIGNYSYRYSRWKSILFGLILSSTVLPISHFLLFTVLAMGFAGSVFIDWSESLSIFIKIVMYFLVGSLTISLPINVILEKIGLRTPHHYILTGLIITSGLFLVMHFFNLFPYKGVVGFLMHYIMFVIFFGTPVCLLFQVCFY